MVDVPEFYKAVQAYTILRSIYPEEEYEDGEEEDGIAVDIIINPNYRKDNNLDSKPPIDKKEEKQVVTTKPPVPTENSIERRQRLQQKRLEKSAYRGLRWGDDENYLGSSNLNEGLEEFIRISLLDGNFRGFWNACCALVHSHGVNKYLLIYCKFSFDARDMFQQVIENFATMHASSRILAHSGVKKVPITIDIERLGKGGIITVRKGDRIGILQVIDGQDNYFSSLKGFCVEDKFLFRANQLNLNK